MKQKLLFLALIFMASNVFGNVQSKKLVCDFNMPSNTNFSRSVEFGTLDDSEDLQGWKLEYVYKHTSTEFEGTKVRQYLIRSRVNRNFKGQLVGSLLIQMINSDRTNYAVTHCEGSENCDTSLVAVLDGISAYVSCDLKD